MKRIFLFLAFAISSLTLAAQKTNSRVNKPDSTKEIKIVEASCGSCKFDLAGNGCNLAVRINGKAYYVTGTTIDEYGDAHAEHGFCNAIRKAEVQGVVVRNKFKVTYFKLLPP